MATQPRVLLVDDNAVALATYERRLRAIGLNPRSVSDGRAGVEAVRSARYDVVVSDVFLPDVSGLEVLRLIRATEATMPVILMTGRPTLEVEQAAAELRAFRLLTKPLVGHLLEVSIQLAISERMLQSTR